MGEDSIDIEIPCTIALPPWKASRRHSRNATKKTEYVLQQSMTASVPLPQSSSGNIIDTNAACFCDLYHGRISYGRGDYRYTAGHGSWWSRSVYPTIATPVAVLTKLKILLSSACLLRIQLQMDLQFKSLILFV